MASLATIKRFASVLNESVVFWEKTRPPLSETYWATSFRRGRPGPSAILENRPECPKCWNGVV